MTAAITLMAKDRDGPKISYQANGVRDRR
ncbi:hypothetical protein [Sphingomonas sp. NFR15]